MSLRILFADDSVTAQNMGKKILTEAGYEVVAVSNGAAAVKKIAEQKPDIIILDVYMPGYTGLEVCEKVRSSIATIKTPVLLTVGKMEPYKPEDANRVRADGVIIKPFEASDLLAIIKKFEERIAETAAAATVAAPPPPAVVQEIKVPAPDVNHEPPPRAVQPIVEVPDHMASSSAFSDLLGTEATRMEEHYAPAAEAAPPPPVQSAPAAVAATEYDVPASWRQEAQPQPTVIDTPVSAASAPAAVPVRPMQIPVYQEPARFEVVPTAAAPIGDIEIPREAGLQETAEEATRNTVADLRDPDLMPTMQHFAQPPRAATASGVAEMPNGAVDGVSALQEAAQHTAMAPEEPQHVIAESRPTTPSLSDADFEARVAAALAAYGQAAESSDTTAVANEEPEVATASDPEETQELTALPDAAPAVTASTIGIAVEHTPELPEQPEELPSVYAGAEPPVSAGQHEPAYVREPEPEMISNASAQAEEPMMNHDAVAARLEAELPAAAEAVAQQAASGETEHDSIAQAVHRVMERMKENLVEEIVRELKAKR
ncbi:MAG TPA: response regulator [Candidatus Angelobacter sp.]|nr:response regulator [Candidatus Angelobacter sp.]